MGTGVSITGKSELNINGNLSVSVAPKHVKGNKSDEKRRGMEIISGGVVNIAGNTDIIVNNYVYTNVDDDDKIASEKDFGMYQQQGVFVSDTDTKAYYGGNLNITMLNGKHSTGILAQKGATLTVEEDTTIKVENAPYYTYGISNQYGDHEFSFNYSAEDAELCFKGNLDITTVGGNNSVGINIKDSKRNSDDKSSITVGGHLNINSSGAKRYEDRLSSHKFPDAVSNYGIFMYNVKNSQFNTAEITTTAEGDGVESIGTYLYWNSNAVFAGDVKYTAVADGGSTEIAALARAGSTIDYQKGFKADAEVVLNAIGNVSGRGSTISVNSSKDADATVQLNGNIVVGQTSTAAIFGDKYDVTVDNADTENIIEANLLNNNSYFTGINEFGNEGSKVNLTFGNGARWNLTGSSQVTALELGGNSELDMTYENTAGTNGFRSLTAKSLSGDGGIINMNIDASKNADNSDRLFITGRHEGKHYININSIGVNDDGAEGTVLVSVGEEDGSFEANDQEGALFWKKYELEKVDSTQDGYTKDWVLAGIERIDDKSTTSVETILGTNAMNYHTWRAESDKLMRRMGELRHNGENEQGVWFRVRGSEISRDDDMAFKNKYTAYEFGYDTVTKQTADLTRYTGVALTYIDGEGSYNNGSGDNHSKALSIYNTDIRSSGHYLDLVFKVADMDNDYRVIDSNRNVITGEYQNTGVSLSAEYGRKNDFANGWYIEPQVQMSVGYLGGDNYKTSNGISVEQGGMASVLGRAGFNIGKKIGADGVVYLKANMLHEFVGDYDIDMTDAKGNVRKESGSFDDTWFEYGIGASIKTGKNNYLYFDFEKTVGGDFKKDWAWNAGMRWNF